MPEGVPERNGGLSTNLHYWEWSGIGFDGIWIAGVGGGGSWLMQ
jgi:hypothetical protein